MTNTVAIALTYQDDESLRNAKEYFSENMLMHFHTNPHTRTLTFDRTAQVTNMQLADWNDFEPYANFDELDPTGEEGLDAITWTYDTGQSPTYTRTERTFDLESHSVTH